MLLRAGFLVPLCLAILVIVNHGQVYAHPGNTASDGMHYCRTNCDSWGVPWGQRHGHSNDSVNNYSSADKNNNSSSWGWVLLGVGGIYLTSWAYDEFRSK